MKDHRFQCSTLENYFEKKRLPPFLGFIIPVKKTSDFTVKDMIQATEHPSFHDSLWSVSVSCALVKHGTSFPWK